jgi:HlyD family secretion protein
MATGIDRGVHMGKVVKILIGLGVLAAAVVGAYAWLQSRGGADDGFKKVEVVSGSITDKAVAVGKIEPRLKFHVKSKISGIVKRCHAEVGDRVNAGDPLFDIVPDPTPSERVEAERYVERAQSAFDQAQREVDRANELSLSGILSRGDHDVKLQTFDQARIGLAQANDNLELLQKGRIQGGGAGMESVVRAPAAGTLLERLVNPGDPVVPLTTYQAGTDLASIAEMKDLIFKGTVDEIDVGKLAIGLPARLRIGALPDTTITGKLTRIAPQATEKDNAKLFEVEIELDPGQDVVLRAGYSANADLVIREKKDILLVPERVITFEDGGKKAFVEIPGPGPKSPVKKVEIATGLSDGLNCEVVSGLKKGDLVVSRPPKPKSDF